jgi:hypothetical protein
MEPRAAPRRVGRSLDGGDRGQGRRLPAKALLELVDDLWSTLHHDHHACDIVVHRSDQVERRGERVHERPEPHALYHSTHNEHAALGGTGGVGALRHRADVTDVGPAGPSELRIVGLLLVDGGVRGRCDTPFLRS